MNNLQHLYEGNDDFRAFVTNHLVVFEKWYRDDLGGERIEDDIEADRWLMAPSNGSDRNDLEVMRLYASKARDLLERTYGEALRFLRMVPAGQATVNDYEVMIQINEELLKLGIEA